VATARTTCAPEDSASLTRCSIVDAPALDGLRRELSGAEGLAAEANHRLLPREDLERSVVLHVGDEELDGVRADVDGGERPHASGILGEAPRNAVKTM
jgi:hypothetical protein